MTTGAQRSGGSNHTARVDAFPVGAGVTLEHLQDPHALLARLRESEPVSWLPALDRWLVTRRDLALRVMRDRAPRAS